MFLPPTPMLAQAQESRLEQDQLMLQQQGKLFTINVSPKSGMLTVHLSGTPLATISPAKLKVLAYYYDLKGNKKELRLTQSPSSFQIVGPMSDKDIVEVTIEDRTDAQKKEQFKIKMKP